MVKNIQQGYSIWVVVGVAVIVSIIASVATVSLTGKAIGGTYTVDANSCNADGLCEANYVSSQSITTKTTTNLVIRSVLDSKAARSISVILKCNCFAI